MSQLMKCYENESCIRHFLASIILLGYNLFVTHHTGQGSSSDLKLVSEILNQNLQNILMGLFSSSSRVGFYLFKENVEKPLDGTQEPMKHSQVIR